MELHLLNNKVCCFTCNLALCSCTSPTRDGLNWSLPCGARKALTFIKSLLQSGNALEVPHTFSGGAEETTELSWQMTEEFVSWGPLSLSVLEESNLHNFRLFTSCYLEYM